MKTSATIIFQIHQFCYCVGCIDKVKTALGELEDYQLLEIYKEVGKFKISTSKHPAVVEFAIKKAFPCKMVTASPEINSNHKINQPKPHLPPTINNRQGFKDVYLDKVPLPAPHQEPWPPYPSAPPIPTTEYPYYGYPPHFYGV